MNTEASQRHEALEYKPVSQGLRIDHREVMSLCHYITTLIYLNRLVLSVQKYYIILEDNSKEAKGDIQ